MTLYVQSVGRLVMVSRISLMPLLVAALCATLRGSEPRGGGEALTPDEANARRTSGYVTVEFRVGDVGSMSGLQGEGMPPDRMPIQLVADAPLKGGGKFYVVINGKLLEDLSRLCIIPEEYLAGAVIRVTGTLTKFQVGTAEEERSNYRMVVLDLEKFRVISRPVK
jgi:hypothetical protein